MNHQSPGSTPDDHQNRAKIAELDGRLGALRARFDERNAELGAQIAELRKTFEQRLAEVEAQLRDFHLRTMGEVNLADRSMSRRRPGLHC